MISSNQGLDYIIKLIKHRMISPPANLCHTELIFLHLKVDAVVNFPSLHDKEASVKIGKYTYYLD